MAFPEIYNNCNVTWKYQSLIQDKVTATLDTTLICAYLLKELLNFNDQ